MRCSGRPLGPANLIVGESGELVKQPEAFPCRFIRRFEVERGLASRPVRPRELLVLERRSRTMSEAPDDRSMRTVVQACCATSLARRAITIPVPNPVSIVSPTERCLFQFAVESDPISGSAAASDSGSGDSALSVAHGDFLGVAEVTRMRREASHRGPGREL